jgi:hypothetical protein
VGLIGQFGGLALLSRFVVLLSPVFASHPTNGSVSPCSSAVCQHFVAISQHQNFISTGLMSQELNSLLILLRKLHSYLLAYLLDSYLLAQKINAFW